MELRNGFKQTEVGAIPENWAITQIEQIADTFSGGTPSTSNRSFYDGSINFITSGDLNQVKIRFVPTRISIDGLNNSSAKHVSANTLLIAMYGATAGVCAITEIEGAINQAILAIIPKSKDFDNRFLFYWWQNNAERLVNKLTQGGQPNLSGQLIRTVQFPIPSSSNEQAAIANVLSDIDVLIGSLGKLIAKKHNIKKGVLQQLLQPKKGWEVKKLWEIGKTYGGLSGKSKSDFENGNNPFIPFMNIMSNPVIDPNYLDYVVVKTGESQNIAMRGDLFFNGSSETPEEVGMCSVLMDDIPNLYLNSFCFGFRLKPELRNNGLFLSYYFRSSLGRKIFYSSAQGATRYNLSKSNFLNLEINLPKPEEQNRIATVISEIDEEIFALVAKLEKYTLIKKGMMQQLLTGKIRLV